MIGNKLVGFENGSSPIFPEGWAATGLQYLNKAILKFFLPLLYLLAYAQ